MPVKVKTKKQEESKASSPVVAPAAPQPTAPKPAAKSKATSRTVAPQPQSQGAKPTAPAQPQATRAANQTNRTPVSDVHPSAAPAQGWGGQSPINKAGTPQPEERTPAYQGPSWGQTQRPVEDQPTQPRPVTGTSTRYTGPSWGNTQPATTPAQVYQGPSWGNTQPAGTQPVPYQGPSWGNTQPEGTQPRYYQGPSWGNTQRIWTDQDFERWRAGERGDPDAWRGNAPVPVPDKERNTLKTRGNIINGVAGVELTGVDDTAIVYPEGYVDQGFTDAWGGDTNGNGYQDAWEDWGPRGYGGSSRPWYDYEQQVEDFFPGMMNWRF